VSGCSASSSSGSFLVSPPLLDRFVGATIEIDVAWKTKLVTYALILSSAVISILSVFPLSACSYGVTVNFALGALTLMANSAATTSSISTESTTSNVSTTSMASPSAAVATTLDEKGGLTGCISEFIGKTSFKFFI